MSERTDATMDVQKTFKWHFNLQEKSFDCDPLLPAFLGFHRQQTISFAQFFSCVDGAQKEVISKAFLQALEAQQGFERLAIINTDNNRYLVALLVNPCPQKNRSVAGELRCLQLFPSKEEERAFLSHVVRHSENALMLTNSEHVIVMVNRSFCEETGYAEHEVLGKSASILKSGQYDPEFYKNIWETVDSKKSWSGELLARNKQQEIYTREIQINRFELHDDRYFYYARSTHLDAATPLLNLDNPEGCYHSNIPDKIQYSKDLQQCFERLANNKTMVFAAFKIDWLQKVNDFTACWLVSQRFYSSGKTGFLGQISAGIYSIYWVEEKNPDKINRLLRELLKVFSNGFDDVGVDLFSTVNFGVSILGVDATDPTQLLAHSTQTLIANPMREGSSVYYFDRRLTKRFNQHHLLAKALKEAIDQQKIEVYYQPIVEIASMQIREFEALCRVQLETDIDYKTHELISIAEEFNWIDAIDAIVTEKALTELAQIQAHYRSKKIAIAVNRSLVNDKVKQCCLEDTLNILLAANVDLHYVTIELTESAVFEDIEKQKQWVEKLQAHGVKIAIDDFGTGYSSFSYLNTLAIDYIKIDRALIRGLTEESNEYAMIEMLCKLVHRIGGEVIVEGVESIEQLALLSRANVDMLQGYLFGKPNNLAAILASPATLTPYPEKLLKSVYRKQQPNIMDLCTTEFKCVEYDDRLSLINEELKSEPRSYFIILGNKRCLGVLYRSDYYHATSPYIDMQGEQKRDRATLDKRIHQVMRKDFMSLPADSEIILAERYLTDHPEAIIIITNDQQECLGIVTIKELVNYYQQRESV